MRKRSRFVAVHNPGQGDPEVAARVFPRVPRVRQILTQGVSITPASLTAGLATAHVSSVGGAYHSPGIWQPDARAIQALDVSESRIRAGIWDLGSWTSGLGPLIEQINDGQSVYELNTIEASIPAGLIARPERVLQWAEDQLGKRMRGREREEFEDNVIADEFFARAEKVRRNLVPRMDYLIGVAPSMVAGTDGEQVYWNHFASTRRRTALVSTYDLRAYAQKAGRPFEVAVVGLALSALFVAIHPKVGYHENTGCVFDYNEARDTLVQTLRNLLIEPACLAKFPDEHRESVAAILEILRSYRRTT